jgi:hypothetical protein
VTLVLGQMHGDAHHTRHNAEGVDLNRNWPYNWRHLTGTFDSGPHPLSEPTGGSARPGPQPGPAG